MQNYMVLARFNSSLDPQLEVPTTHTRHPHQISLLLIKTVKGRLPFRVLPFPFPPLRTVFLIPPSPQSPFPFPRASHA
jgi:hypothetical protein